MEENLSRISQLTIKLCTFSICVSSIVFAQTPLVAFVSYQPWPLMVEWYIWKVGWFRVFGCSSSRGASALPQITILALTSLFKTDISLHPLEQQCMQTNKQGCINRGTCSHPELTQDQVLTSAYVIIFCTVATNAVNKSVWRKKDCSWLPFNKHATNVSLLFSFRSLPVTFDLVDRSVSCQYGTHAPI